MVAPWRQAVVAYALFRASGRPGFFSGIARVFDRPAWRGAFYKPHL